MVDYRQIEEQIEQYIGAESILGMGIGIVQNEEIVYCNGFGTTSIEDQGLPITSKTIFAIGSTSKTINALMIMRLVEQGLLDLDKPVVDYLSGYVFSENPPWGSQVTLRHLLSHTSGFACGGKGWGPPDLDALRRWVWDEIAHFTFLAEPGRVPYYGNGPSVAGHVAEIVTGKYYPQLIEEQVFNPLDMQRSTYDRRVAMTYPLALPHNREQDRKLAAIHHYADNPSGNPEGFCLSTVDDMINLLLVLLNQGRFSQGPYLDQTSVTAMQIPHGDYRAEVGNHVRSAMILYEGLGLSIGHYKGVRTFGHSGLMQSMSTMFDVFPDKGFGVVCVSNYCDLDKRNELLFQIYDQLLDTPSCYHFPSPKVISDEAHQVAWPQYEGTYLAPWGTIAIVSVQDGKLTISIDEETHILTPITAEQYYFETHQGFRTPISFFPEAEGLAQLVLVNIDLFNRCTLNTDFKIDATILSKYEGLYANYIEGNILDGFYIRVREGRLYLFPAEQEGLRIALDESKGLPSMALSPTRFVTDSSLYDFEIASDGSVSYVTKELAFRYWPVNDV